jgi:hypothetical protein
VVTNGYFFFKLPLQSAGNQQQQFGPPAWKQATYLPGNYDQLWPLAVSPNEARAPEHHLVHMVVELVVDIQIIKVRMVCQLFPSCPSCWAAANYKWRDASVVQSPSHLLHTLPETTRPYVFLPDLWSYGSYKPQLIYFKIALKVMQGTNAAQGCDGTMSMRYTQWQSRKCDRCDGVHLDSKEGNIYTKQDLQKLWDFLQQPKVAEYFLPMTNSEQWCCSEASHQPWHWQLTTFLLAGTFLSHMSLCLWPFLTCHDCSTLLVVWIHLGITVSCTVTAHTHPSLNHLCIV